MLFDVHCHLNDRRYKRDLNEVVGRAAEAGVIAVNSTVELSEVDEALSFCERYGNVRLTIGCSPTEFDDRNIEGIAKRMRENRGRIIGVGEVGLDHYWVREEGRRMAQERNFVKFVEISDELKLPLVVHSRESNKEVLDILSRRGKTALMHCFSGTVEEAEEFIGIGCLISIPTSVVHSKARQELVKRIPLDTMTLETDAPYMAPEPKARNEPANVKTSARKIAELRNTDYGTVEEVTTRNAKRFFKIP